MTDDARLERTRQAARASLGAFAKLIDRRYQLTRFHRSIAAHLEAVARGEIQRLIVEVQPRIGKTVLGAIDFAGWWIGAHPDRDFVHVTFGLDRAGEVGLDVRNLLASPAFRFVYPDVRVDPRSDAKRRLDLLNGGGYRSTAPEGSLTGHGAHIIVVDDPIKNFLDADSPTERRKFRTLWSTTIMTRREPDCPIVMLLQRWNGEDPAAWLQREEAGDWHVLSLPAFAEPDTARCCELGEWRAPGEVLWPEKWSAEALEKIRQSMESKGSLRWWFSQYQQRPTVAQGEILRREWIDPDVAGSIVREWSELPGRFDAAVLYWDCKLGGSQREGTSYAVGEVWGRRGGDLYFVDEVRFRGGLVAVLDATRQLRDRYPWATPIVVEAKASGVDAIDIMRTAYPDVLADDLRAGGSTELSKRQRMEAVAPLFRAGSIWQPSRRRASWIADWREELLAFPNGRYNDRVDTTSGALRYLRARPARRLVAPSGVEKEDWTA